MYAHRMFAEIDLARGEVQAAAGQVAHANRLAQRQLQLEPDNADWQQGAAKSRLVQADILLWQAQPRSALAALDAAKPLVTGLLARDPKLWAWRVELQETQAQVESDVLRALGRRQDALRIAEESARRLEGLMDDPALRLKAMPWLARSEGRAARLLDEEGASNAAHARWQRLAALGATRMSTLDAEALAWLSRAQQALGNTSASQRISLRLQMSGYRHPGYQLTAANSEARPSHREDLR